ncbi:hypothetical protein [Legionella fallonii]|uniref:Uncharacterized protein n=1 Tax=Legionella fallonii LLAP-10 TaxID=1212491 RepID=A0A098GBC0_9GAMM|nr:hypothetical protein [Legionella fallonii]CEG58771.1 protein of unknown function [Legionella fallonii LLAP-10]
MAISSLPTNAQAIYMQFLKNKALKMAKHNIKRIPMDPQGRMLIDISFTAQDIQKIKMLDTSIDEKIWANLVGQNTTVSLDIKGDKKLKKEFDQKLLDALKKEDPERYTAIHKALETTPKGSIIALQQEFDFHLRLASRVYQKAVDELGLKEVELKQAHRAAMHRVNEDVTQAYAAALKKAYQGNKIDLGILNSELDKARKAITPLAHQYLREEIIKSTKVTFNEKSFNQPLRELAEKMTATPNDLLHTDNESGLATWIEGSEVTSHDRGEGEKHLASRHIVTHSYDSKTGKINPHPHARNQIRVPSLDAKNTEESEEWHVEDVYNKIATLAERYDLGEQDVRPNKAFIYNLHTSLYHLMDDHFNENMQTQGAKQIIEGAHRYNASLLETASILNTQVPPLCFVQNIPINGFGSALGYGSLQRELVEEASLMSEIALLHTVYKTATVSEQKAIDSVIDEYKKYLATPQRTSAFCASKEGKNAIGMIQAIKTEWKKAPIVPQADVVANATACLRNLIAHNMHFDKEYAKLTQSLSVLVEEASISGCKSANERAQLINSRVAVLDALLLRKPPLTPEQTRLFNALQAFASSTPQSNPRELAKELKLALDLALNDTGLQSALSLVSLVDQGASAKAQVASGIGSFYNGNKFEEPTLTHLHQSKSSHMQAHKELGEEMTLACTEKVGKKAKVKPVVCKTLAEKAAIDAEEQQGLLRQVGHYKEDKDVPNHQFVNERLGSSSAQLSEAQKKLYSGIEKYQKNHLQKMAEYCKAHNLPIAQVDNPNFFREQFIKYSLSRDFTPYTPPSSGDSRKNNPEEATRTLNEFFGQDGAELYQLALKEERYSKEYMDAVFCTSTTHHKGEKWAQRPVIIVAGPSASGKSTAAHDAVKRANAYLPKVTTEGAPPGNDVVAVDGGVFREVSQMRKLAIRLANKQGYTGISDLHDQSAILGKGKKCIQKAVYETPSLGVVIPETFSNPLKVKTILKKIEKLENTQTIFTRVDGAEPTTFRRVVGYLGSRRAWKTSKFDQVAPLDLNSTEDLCESKAYGKQGFYWGQKGSIAAEKWYREHGQNKISFLIANDLLLIKPAKGKIPKSKAEQWENAEKNDEGALLVNRRLFDAWVKSDEPELNKFIKDNPRPSSLIYTVAEQNILEAVQQLEDRIDYEQAHRNRQEKIEILGLALNIVREVNPNKADSITLAIETINAMRKQNVTLSIHKTQRALAHVVGALEQRLEEVNQLDAVKNKVDNTSLNQEWQKIKRHQESEVNSLFTTLDSLRTIRKPLESIINNTFSWLNPAFQSSAKTAATALTPSVPELADGCDKLVAYLQQQKTQLTKFLEQLPKKEEIKGKPHSLGVEQHRQKLQSSLDQIEDELNNILLPAQKILRGDLTKSHVVAKDGLVKTIETAVENQQDIQLFTSFKSEHEDISIDKKNELLQTPLPQVQRQRRAVHLEQDKEKGPIYQMVSRVKEGECRKHTISNSSGEKIGIILEERTKEKALSDGSPPTHPNLEITVPRFPEGDAKTDIQAREDKITVAFAAALQMLAGYEKPPTKDKPLKLDGSDKEAMQFVYTALLIIGEHSSIPFKADAIKVGVPERVFNPKDEQGYFSTFSMNSCYNKYFKNSEVLKDILKGVKELSADKMGHEKAQKKLEDNIQQVTNVFREKMHTIINTDLVADEDEEDQHELS